MTRPFMRNVIDALLPDGAIWQPAFGGFFDRLINGIAKNKQSSLNDLGSLSYLRDPMRCSVELLPDLEREYGLLGNGINENERRMMVSALRYKRIGLPTAQKLQEALDAAGFGRGGNGLFVTPNSPPTNPYSIIERSYMMTAHDFPSIYCAGSNVAIAGYGGGYYLVTGDHYIVRPLYPQAGNIVARAFSGSDPQSGRECAGFFEETVTSNEAEQYRTPPQPYWPLIFFVGGMAARNENGQIANVAIVSVAAERRQELHRLILRIVPIGIWAGMMVRYV